MGKCQETEMKSQMEILFLARELTNLKSDCKILESLTNQREERLCSYQQNAQVPWEWPRCSVYIFAWGIEQLKRMNTGQALGQMISAVLLLIFSQQYLKQIDVEWESTWYQNENKIPEDLCVRSLQVKSFTSLWKTLARKFLL